MKKNNSGRKQRNALGRKLLTEVLEDRQLLASDLASSVCVGLTCTETESFSGVPDLDDAVVFDQFDPAIGELLSVKVTLELTSEGGSFEADNDSDQPATFDVEFGAEGDISSADVGLFSAVVPVPTPVIGTVATSQGATFNLTGNDGDDIDVFNQGGTDWDMFDGVTTTEMSMGNIDPSLFAAYEGTSTFDIDYDVRQVADTTSAGGVFRQIGPVSASGTITVEYTYKQIFNPDIELDKFLYEVNGSTDVSGDIFPGDDLLYVFEVENTGDIVLDNVMLTDSLAGVTIGPNVFASLADVDADSGVAFDGDIDPSETVFFVGTYTVTEADADAGEILNSATVTGDDPDGTTTDDGGTEVTPVRPLNPDIELDKFVWDINGEIADGTEVVEIGDEIIYAFEVTNTGDVELTNVEVTDALPGVVISDDVFSIGSAYSQPAFIPADGVLGPFASTESTLVSDPFEAKAWDNFTLSGTAVLDGIDWAGAYIEPFSAGITPETDFVIEIYDDASGSPGSLVYAFSLDGGLAGVSDADVMTTLLGHSAEDGGPVYAYSADLPKTELHAGDYWISITAHQTFPNPFPKIDPTWQWHLGSGPGDGFYTYDDIFDDPGDEDSGFVDGTPHPVGFDPAKDLAFTLNGKYEADFDGSLDPGETVVFVGTYIVTPADAVAGMVMNNATATGDDPTGDPVDDSDKETVPVAPINPGIELDKFVWDINGVPVNGGEIVNVGDEIIYAFEVTNTGDVDLTDVSVSDPLPGLVIGSDVYSTTSPYSQPNFIPADGILGPFASTDSTLATDPFEAKAWDNFTLASTTVLDGVDWAGAYIEPFSAGITPETDFVIEIFADDSGSPGSLAYSFFLDGGLAGVSDADVMTTLLGHTAEDGGPVYQYSAVLPKTELHAGDYWISITAQQTFPNPFPKIDPTWQWHLGSGPGDGFYTYDDVFDDAGDNDLGLVDGTPTPAVFDPEKDLAFTLSGKHAVSFDGVLSPGETAVFVGTYIVTDDDSVAGEVVNTATATGDDPAGNPVTDDDTETVPVVQIISSIEIDKFLWDINGSPVLHPNINPGDELLYAFNVTNTGDTKLSNVTVTDSLPGFVMDEDVTVPYVTFDQPYTIPGDGVLGPFASKDALSADDMMEAKAWDNFTIAKPTVIDGLSWVGAYIEPFADPGLTPDTDFFVEIFADNGSGAPGHLVEYFPLRGGMAGVSDENVPSTLLGHTAEDGGPVYSYSAMLPFTLLQAGEYWLSITAVQSFPNPDPIVDPTWQWHLGSGAGDGFYFYDEVFDDVGDGRPFPAQFSDSKDLAFTVHAARLDPEFNGMLLPGETVMYMGVYYVTEEDVLAGEVVNKGTVTADDPKGVEVMDMDTLTTPIAQRDPDIDVNKYLWDINGSPTLTTEINVGDELIYSLDVTNTGGTKLTNVEVTDSLPDAVFDEQVVVPFVAYEQNWDLPDDGNLGPFSSVDRTLASDPQEAKAWDNFSFAEDTVIDGVSWVGAYIEPFAGGGAATPETDFLIEIFSDDTGPDAEVLSFTVNGGDAGVNDAQLVTTELFHTAEEGGPVYSYKAMIPFTYIVAGDYWISITALQTFPNESPTVDPTWQWHLAESEGADGFYSYDDVFDDVGDGTPFAANYQEDKDLTFTLHGAKQVDFNGMLLPGEMVMFMVTYYVTEEDVLAGEIVNKGTVTAHDPDGGTVMDMDTETVIIDTPPISPPMPPADDPSIFIDKYLWDINGSPDLHNDIKVGDELIYGIDVENTGNVKLSDIVVTDQVWLVEVDQEVAIPYVAYEQGPFVPASGAVGAYSSVDRDSASDPGESKAWDNFSTNRADDWTVVDAITWYGAYDEPFADGSSPETDFLIEFAEADGDGKPGTVLHTFTAKGGVAGVEDENVKTTLLSHTSPDGGPVYKYHAMLPFSGFVNGDYFVSITALQTFPSAAPTIDPSWQWHLGSGSGDGFYTYDDVFDDAGDGTPYAANLEAGKDLAFKLHAAELIDDFDGMLDPGERVMYMARYIVRQIDLDKGVFQNDAKVVAEAPDGTVLTELDWEHVYINQNPSVTIAAAPGVVAGQAAASTQGMVPMRYTVTNAGDVTLENVVVTDEGEGNAIFVGTDEGDDGVMSPGEVWLFEGMGQNGMETQVTAGTLTGDNVTAELMHDFCVPSNGDIDGDGEVAFSDFLVLSRNFGASDADLSLGDLDCDGEVAFSDFLILSRNFGQSTVAAEGTAAAAAAATDAAFDSEDEWLV